ncbi:acyl-CoA dehydrogenase [Streptomyces sp. WZ.A104]|uniref:acyl-CoA dehydrogenase family protein n=1 Tax=Streptomyces sp. WZ.A104 TaxID=2023771 RepID=UPI000BBC43D7|nr:acyl-CoA dehydrogenase family protein [Streptomyces sp. WZ.A104]PCG84229.1 acyl-CoA dehydrogenase [Streptomyces sp. WZ.A104]
MATRLAAHTPEGERAAVIAERIAPFLAERAARYDREATFPTENLDDARDSGLLGACVPKELGGLGVELMRDLTVVVNRLAHGDAGTAIALHMQLAREWYFARRLRESRSAQEREHLAATLRSMADGSLIACGATSEAGADHDHVRTEATPVPGGYRINGKKIFVTLSAAATDFYLRLRVPDPSGGYQMASAHVPRDTPGLTVVAEWDALGMRTSGSNDVVLEDVFVPTAAVSPRGPWGVRQPSAMIGRTVSNLALQGAYLGCAEAARDLAVRHASRALGRDAAAPGTVHAVGEMEVKLATARSVLDCALTATDEALTGRATADVPHDQGLELMVAFQAAKTHVTRVAQEIVHDAMTLVGGAAYLSAHPLARISRDVRAGTFMQPHAPLEALDLIGRTAVAEFSAPDVAANGHTVAAPREAQTALR